MNNIEQKKLFIGQKSKYLQQESKNVIRAGQSFVYFAIDQNNSEQVAIKIYFKEESYQRDLDAIKKTSCIQCENLIKLYDQCQENSIKKFLVFEYCNLGDLYNYLIQNKKGVQSLDDAIKVTDIALQISKGMEQLNMLKLVHRDLKPENILIHKTKEDQIVAKITDYGLAKDSERLVTVLGTPNYMAPEIIFKEQPNEQYDEKVDVWAFGMILYEMFTCQQFFKGDLGQIFNQIKNFQYKEDDCKQLSQFQEIKQLFQKCIQKNAQGRPDFKQINHELAQIYQKLIKEKQMETNLDFSIICSNLKLTQGQLLEQTSILILEKQQNFEDFPEIQNYQFDQIQIRIIEKINKNDKLLKKLGYLKGIEQVDLQKYKGIAIFDSVISVLSPLILQIIFKDSQCKSWLEEIKQNVETSGNNKQLKDQINFMIEFIQSNMNNRLFLNIIDNLFQEQNCAKNIFQMMQIYLSNQKNNQFGKKIENVDSLIQESKIINLNHKLQLNFTQDFNSIDTSKEINQIVITNKFISNKKYTILVPYKTYDYIFKH